MNAACEIASTYLNNTQSVCDQAAATTTKCKKELKTIQKLSHGPHRWWHFLLSDFIALFSSSGAFRRVVGIYVNKCFNFILHSSQKNLIKSSALHYRMPRLPICFHNLLQINCNNSWWMPASTNLQPLTFYDSRHYFICQSFIEMCYWNIFAHECIELINYPPLIIPFS